MPYLNITNLVNAVILNYETRHKKNKNIFLGRHQNIFIDHPQKTFFFITQLLEQREVEYKAKHGHGQIFDDDKGKEDFYAVANIEGMILNDKLAPIEADFLYWYKKCIARWDFSEHSLLLIATQFDLLKILFNMQQPDDPLDKKCFSSRFDMMDELYKSNECCDSDECCQERLRPPCWLRGSRQEKDESSDEEDDYYFCKEIVYEIRMLSDAIRRFKNGKSNSHYEKLYSLKNETDAYIAQNIFSEYKNRYYPFGENPPFEERIYGKTPQQLAVIEYIRTGKIDSSLPKSVVENIASIILI